MKKPILSSIFCLAFAFALHAQEKQLGAPELKNPFVSPPPNIGVWPVLKGMHHAPKPGFFVPPKTNYFSADAFAQPLKLAGTFPAAVETGVCSIPLLEAHADAADPGIVMTPNDHSVPIPQAHVPAPSCKK